MKKHLFILLSLLSIFFLVSCEKEITVNLPNGEQNIVVEGYIESDTIPYVLLTYDIAYFDKLSLNQLSNLFVKDAKVWIIDETTKDSIDMMEFKIKLPSGEKDSVEASIYIPNFFSPTIVNAIGKAEHTYTLHVKSGDKKVTATTTIPKIVPIDSAYFTLVDSTTTPFLPDCYDKLQGRLYRLEGDFADPAGVNNYYRYFTSVDNGQSYQANDNSVFSPTFFNGQQIQGIWFQLGREADDSARCGRFVRIDTLVSKDPVTGVPDTVIRDKISLKFCSIDKAQYDFWETFGNNISGNGPFSPPISVKSNVKGGLGLWAGQAAYHIRNLQIPR
ncbi:MAG: DUF4249 domain-containing protein [Bacteroidia bacterium]